MTEQYRVQLDIYNGPLDLLLYLIQREEVDIHDIPIARIAKQYIDYVEMLQGVDPNLAGDFLVLAATLMEIKTRMLLPVVNIDAETQEEVAVDPRSELVRQLLEYKSFKDAADDLDNAREIQDQKFPRSPARIPENNEKEIELEDVQIWDLFDAFKKVMDSIGHLNPNHEVIYDDTPIEIHQTDILHQIKGVGRVTFSSIFEGATSKTQIVGMFLAILELARQQKVFTLQSDNFDDIILEENPNPPTPEQIQQQDKEHEQKMLEMQNAGDEIEYYYPEGEKARRTRKKKSADIENSSNQSSSNEEDELLEDELLDDEDEFIEDEDDDWDDDFDDDDGF